jgi:hypothetical protein
MDSFKNIFYDQSLITDNKYRYLLEGLVVYRGNYDNDEMNEFLILSQQRIQIWNAIKNAFLI